MNLKLVAYIVAFLFVLVIVGGVGYKLVQRSEGYKAEKQEFYSFEPHIIGGCAMYKAYQRAEKPKVKPIVKPEVKK